MFSIASQSIDRIACHRLQCGGLQSSRATLREVIDRSRKYRPPRGHVENRCLAALSFSI